MTVRGYILVIAVAVVSGCGGNYAPLATAPSVDLKRYAGLWYEIASKPVSQQEGCRCTTAEYSLLEDGVIRVVNTCIKDGERSEANRKNSRHPPAELPITPVL